MALTPRGIQKPDGSTPMNIHDLLGNLADTADDAINTADPHTKTWTAFTPTWTAPTTNPSLGNGTLAGSYSQVGKTVIGAIRLAFGTSTTSGTGAWTFTPPVLARGAHSLGAVGQAVITDSSAGTRYVRTIYQASSDAFRLIDDAGAYVGAGTPITFANGDRIHLNFTYEAA